ncbi:helix-turn-helix domain-containing protein [uncultured Microbacterium sp.]|uniref:helix-turn-helix domain-containing protein n=1 Tax=uncultured Microbacterium sp. TaxID=191216 RepID=UPI0035CAFAA7
MSESSDDAWARYTAALGIALERARRRRRLSQDVVAAAAGIASFTYRKLEKGVSNPGTPANPQLLTLVKLAEVLDVPLVSLLPADPGGIAPGIATEL